MATTAEPEKVARLFKELVRAKMHRFPSLGERLDAPKSHGVYLIRSRSGRVLHVGRTERAKEGIFQRLNNHLHNQSSFTEQFLDGDGAKLRRYGYTYSYLAVKSPRLRALLENYAIGHLCPRHLGTGESF